MIFWEETKGWNSSRATQGPGVRVKVRVGRNRDTARVRVAFSLPHVIQDED